MLEQILTFSRLGAWKGVSQRLWLVLSGLKQYHTCSKFNSKLFVNGRRYLFVCTKHDRLYSTRMSSIRNDVKYNETVKFETLYPRKNSLVCYLAPAFTRGLYSSAKYSMSSELFRDYVQSLIEEHEELSDKMRKQGLSLTESKRFNELFPIVDVAQRLQQNHEEMQELLVIEKDSEMKSLAAEDIAVCRTQIEELESELFDSLVIEEDFDNNDIMMEVSAGIGGQESMLFAKEIFEMYKAYAESQGWTFDVIDYETAAAVKNSLGLRHASVNISGEDVHKFLKFESGVHRVQRVPETEKSGRVHTSTITVAILPQPTEIDVVLDSKELHIETLRASGPGGQHVNKTESAVRVTHLPTKTVAYCQKSRFQIQNKEAALQLLRSKLYEKKFEALTSQTKAQRKLQIGSRGRSEKIRTYNFNQDRITDHRLGKTYHNIQEFMNGGDLLHEALMDLHAESKMEILNEKMEEIQSVKKKMKKDGAL